MAGIGDVFLSHLSSHPRATTAELAALVPHKPLTTVVARLRVMSVEEGRLVLLERAQTRPGDVWSISSGGKTTVVSRQPRAAKGPPVRRAPPEVKVPTRVEAEAREEGPAPTLPSTIPDVQARKGWKPRRKGDELEGEPKKGEYLLVEFPQRWRHSLVCFVTSESPDLDGVIRVWDMRDRCFCHVDARGWRGRGWKVWPLTKKDVADLMSIKLSALPEET